MTPIPPPLVMITVLSPGGGGEVAINLHQSNPSLTDSARSTPHWRIISLNTSSDPARDPVCDAAAIAPRAERPDFKTITGFTLVAADNALMSFSPSCTPSIYMKITLVC